MDAATTANMLQTMQDQAGIPSHPLIFQILMVFTWIPHILFVNISLGAALVGLYAFTKRQDPNWQLLSEAMTKVAKVGVSLLVVLGVAPLLFTQTIYDPSWYASNVLSAAWVIGFIFTLTIGYLAWFTFYLKNHGAQAPGWIFWLGVFGLAMFLLDGFIMHVLAYQGLHPEKWLSWYTPGGHVDMSGTAIHAFELPRWGFFMAMSLTVFGAFLIAYGDYFKVRADRAPAYLDFARALGAKIAITGALLQVVLLLWWLIDVPAQVHVWTHPMTWLLAAYLFVLLAAFWLARSNNAGQGYRLLAMSIGMAALVSIFREVLRMAYLHPFNYDILNYKVLWDIPSFALFLFTIVVVGGLMGGFIITLVYKAGRVQGPYEADATVTKLGNGSLASTAIWVVVFIGTGIWIWLRNNG
ncbi:hypothetical protein [Halothiobacillus sp.]|jgi:hypothetical protein|uniref:hypothetical protein n=1 Tax=Halothiobacillus sp. TaxID=1891311 RepID=UPI00260654F1|nr:hypothetical protein [Halothiobacillus sp.]MDD3575807.1 hypothetical protein [Halothiobacillus sp.]MDD4966098.1 hypothetical protein [Halothiobacillus sp.]MDY0147052.1 hypothetical protein [Halothiobacillus sp.]